MENAIVILKQIILMFFYMAIGFLMFRTKLISKEGSKALANLLLYVSLPCVIIKSFSAQSSGGTLEGLLYSLLAALILLLLAMGIGALLFRRDPLANFSAAFSNAGFMGVPLITAALGASAVFYTAGMVALLNIFQWTYGQNLIKGGKQGMPWVKTICNPLTVSFLIGLVLFVTDVSLPSMAESGLSTLANLNGPLAMIVLGVYFAQTQMGQMFRAVRNYEVCIVRLVLIPVLSIGLLCLVPKQFLVMKQELLIAACAPVGANVAVYAQKLDKDYTYAVQLVCLSTLFSVITMPVIIGIASYVWRII